MIAVIMRSMQQFEQLGMFYLGKRFDLAARRRLDEFVLYDAKDLVTHAVCVGMTGSGKTGLGLTVIEEAAIDNIPVLAIDPKGDISNLLLTFPSLTGSDFAPWVDPSDASAQGLDPDAYAAQQADKWKKGLAEWGEDGDRIARFKAAANVTVFTPGSRAGTPLALLKSLAGVGSEDSEDAASRVASTADSLLALAGVTDAEGHSRERTLVATILARATADDQAGLPWLVQQIQRPSFDRVGVLDLETFYPAKDRQELALRFNSVLAAPGFDVWLDGVPLDPGAMLYGSDGKPRVAIVSIAHLGDAERMLVVSLLLNALVEWTRRQRGTTSLRALIYMDEVFGYLPPVANPPSKAPLLTLLKQARAYGVGIMLATQNPVDLDYKALSNTGTWFLGKLQTERDKARVLDGLEGVAGGLDRATLDTTLSALGSRVFLMHNVHEHEPVVFETRWTLSYLRGPLGRDELRKLTKTQSTPDAQPTTVKTNSQPPTRNPEVSQPAARSPKPAASGGTARPIVPSGIQEVFVPPTGGTEHSAALYGSAKVQYTDTKRGIDVVQEVNAVAPFTTGAVPIDWENAADAPVPPQDLATAAPADATFSAPPAVALDPKRYTGWSRDFVDWVVRSRPVTIYSAKAVKLTSAPGESERDFRMRVQMAGREARDAQVERLRGTYATKVARATEKVRKAEEGISREQQQVTQQRLQTAVSVGATLLGAFLGRKAMSASTLGRATTVARGVGRSMKETEDVASAQERLTLAQQELAGLQQQIESEASALSGTTDPEIETVELKPKRGNVDVRLVALAWIPKN
jgi:hypothetical protein